MFETALLNVGVRWLIFLLCRADYKNNENEVFKRLNNIENKINSKKGGKSNMNDAVDDNEAIRGWVRLWIWIAWSKFIYF